MSGNSSRITLAASSPSVVWSGRHPNVGQYRVGRAISDQREPLRTVAGLPDDVETRAEQDVIFGQDHPHRSHRRANTLHRGGAMLTAMPFVGHVHVVHRTTQPSHSNLRRRLRFVADGEHPGNREHRAVGPRWIGVAQLGAELCGKLLGVVG